MAKLIKWEKHLGGSAEAEASIFRKLADDMMQLQLRSRPQASKDGMLRVDRALHAKPLLAVKNARLEVLPNLPDDLKQAHFTPGARFDTTVRISNGNSKHQADAKEDLRGIALRLDLGDASQDLLLTNHPVNHARDARQFVRVAKATPRGKIPAFLILLFTVGPFEASRIGKNLRTATSRPVCSLATESFWSRGALLWGTAGPVRLKLYPALKDDGSARAPKGDESYLSKDIARRLNDGDVVWTLALQRFINPNTTPIEDASIDWPPQAKWINIATLTIPRQDVTTTNAQADAADVEALSFNPWYTIDAFRPLGNINRARKSVYAAVAAHRRRERFVTPVPARNKVVSRLGKRIFGLVNRRYEWHQMPVALGILNLSLLRKQLREENLIDTRALENAPDTAQPPAPIPEEFRWQRSFDGSYNDLSDPEMGRAWDKKRNPETGGEPFGRSMPAAYLATKLAEPDPVEIATGLLHRKTFQPAGIINLLAASWVQFQVHDWVKHQRHPLGKKDINLKLPDGMQWSNTENGPRESVMRIAGDVELGGAHAERTYGNEVTHWWDGSGVYGSNHADAARLRDGTGSRLRMEKVGHQDYLPMKSDGQEDSGFTENWWLGLSAMHTLFALEHNVVAGELERAYPAWSDDRVYHVTRLVISALIAKIHTVEWTPAILARKEIDIALNANWSGPRGWLVRLAIWLQDTHALKGITETLPNHHGVPFSLTEEFVTVYRMHQLIPDEYRFFNAISGAPTHVKTFSELHQLKTGAVMRDIGLENVFYSFGIGQPGRVCLHNYPLALTNFLRPGVDGQMERLDLSVADIMRERSRGIPRYNAFRKGVHRKPIERWEDMTADPDDADLMKRLYGGRLDLVDSVVGLAAETPPTGYGFSDTAFRIFTLMATRRLQSDRFLTVDFRPEIYSPLGIDWVQKTTLSDIILRHMPELSGVLPTGESAFAPWRERAR